MMEMMIWENINSVNSIKPAQRIRLLELAYKMSQLDDVMLKRMLESCSNLCSVFNILPVDPFGKPMGKEVAEFVKDECEIGSEREVKASELYMAFKNYCIDNGVDSDLSQRHFGQIIGKQFKRKKSNVVYYTGISLKSTLFPPEMEKP